QTAVIYQLAQVMGDIAHLANIFDLLRRQVGAGVFGSVVFESSGEVENPLSVAIEVLEVFMDEPVSASPRSRAIRSVKRVPLRGFARLTIPGLDVRRRWRGVGWGVWRKVLRDKPRWIKKQSRDRQDAHWSGRSQEKNAGPGDRLNSKAAQVSHSSPKVHASLDREPRQQ